MDNQELKLGEVDITLTDPPDTQQIAIAQQEPVVDIKTSPFDQIRHEDEKGEFWLARELQKFLNYSRWNDFVKAVERARQSFTVVGLVPEDHIEEVLNMVQIGSGAQREVKNFRLTRRACYCTTP